jgi:peptide/nickel transport system permease protein
MSRYLLRQLLGMIVLLLVTSFVIYASLFLAPGSPDALLFGAHTVSPALRAAVNRQYHLNDPFLQQYWYWLVNVLHGNFGTSITYRTPVALRLSAAAPVTAFLVIYSAILIIVSGVALGVLSALRPGKLDTLIMTATNIGTAVPTFVAGLILLAIFGVKLNWFPVYGAGAGFFDRLRHLTLPAVALAFWAVAYLTRVTRTSMREELQGDPVMTARSRGLSRRVVVQRHAFRNALIPIVTVAGLQVAGLIAGTVIVEQVFGLNGLGELLLTSVQDKDFATVQAVSLILVAAFIVVNTLVDITYTMLDPRIRLGANQS